MRALSSVSFIFLITSAPLAVQAEDPTVNAPVAVVNGTPISTRSFELYRQLRLGSEGDAISDEQRQKLVEELVNRELIYMEAGAILKNPDVQQEIQEQTRNIVTRYRIRKLLDDHPPSEGEMKRVYKQQVVEAASTEYQARHILVETEKEALDIVIELDNGADFSALAKKKSMGSSAPHGGDLGWFAPNQVMKPIADAVSHTAVGKYTDKPIQTDFGWHVILVENKRKAEPPTFEDVEKQVRIIVENKIIGEFISGLRNKATIKLGTGIK
ncbi:MAG: peptidylprolyl isomerase [Gammaproteobacteria bacterium]|nr:peptidylprolyl isomerase [Gammaproteobacteria bacterium]